MLNMPVPLLLAKGWKGVDPRPVGLDLVWQSGNRLFRSSTDFVSPRDLGSMGHIDTPFAVDHPRQCVYSYVCQDRRGQRDFSEVRAYSLNGGEPSKLFSLALNKWIPWFLTYLPERDVIVGLVASSLPGDQLRIQHQLGFFNPATRDSLLISLPRDAFLPLDVRSSRREILFYGVEGYQIIDYTGKRQRLLRGMGLPNGRGAAFHPLEDRVALGGRGIHVWNLKSNELKEIHPRGQMPVWSPDGRWLYFSESSGDLFRHDGHGGGTERLVAVAGNSHAEVHFARKVSVSMDGRYLALPVTRRVKRRNVDAETMPVRSEFACSHALCIIDCEQRQVWQASAKSSCVGWYQAPP